MKIICFYKHKENEITKIHKYMCKRDHLCRWRSITITKSNIWMDLG